MILNPHTEEFHKEVQAEEIERVRREIRKLPTAVRELIEQGEETIDEAIRFQNLPEINKLDFQFHGVNVFNLGQDVPGDVLKYLMMLYTAGGYLHVSFSCSCFHSNGDQYRVKYPNEITMRSKR